MRVCHVIDSMHRKMGGTSFSVAELTEGLSDQGIATSLFTIDYKFLGEQLIPPGVDLHRFSGTSLTKKLGGIQPCLQSSLEKATQNGYHLIHNHGLWLFANLYARRAAAKNNLPLVVSPRGMLESWSLKRGRLKKKLVWFLWEKRNLKAAAAFHATSMQEADSIRQLGFKQPIAVIPNSIELPSLEGLAPRETLETAFPHLKAKQWLLFMSRIHPKKGLEELLSVWKELEGKFPQWHLIIAGSDITGYGRQLNAFIGQNSLQERVTLTGMLTGSPKEAALGNSSLFVLPTHSENFGRVIAESLSYAVPVITTKGSPWEDLEKYRCGWWIPDDQQALQRALLQALGTPREELKRMGQRGRDLVKEKYGSKDCVRQMINVYKWLIDGGQAPSCIRL